MSWPPRACGPAPLRQLPGTSEPIQIVWAVPPVSVKAAQPGGILLPRGDPMREQLNDLLWFPNFLHDLTECLSSRYLDQISLPVLQVSNFLPIIDFPTVPRYLSSDIIL